MIARSIRPGLALSALALLAAGASAAAPATATPAEAGPVRVRLVKGTATAGGRWVAASVGAEQRATLSTRLSAVVRSVSVEEGSRVAKGQLLLRLSDDGVRAQLAAAESALSTAAAQERRITALAAERAATRSELDMAQSQRAQAAAAMAAARASLAYTEIRAPFAGSIQARHVEAGDLVGPGRPLVEIQGSGLEIQANLSEAEAHGLRIGQRLGFEAGSRQGTAEITALSPGGDALSHRRSLRARVISDGEGLRTGTFARLELAAGAPAAAGVWVPQSALVERGDLTGVFIAEGGRAQLRWISVGEPAGGGVPVRAGLKVGEPVIDAPGALRDGQAVEVQRGAE